MKRIVIIFIFTYSASFAVDIGSDSAVTLFTTQQILQTGDRIAGFAGLMGGFAFAGNSSYGTFDSFFSVAGNVALNYATLVLNQDLIFNNVAALDTWGDISGNHHIFSLSPAMSAIPSEGLQDCTISFLTSANDITQINSVDWNSLTTFVAVGMNDLGGANPQVRIYSWNGTTIAAIVGATVDINATVNSVNWHASNSWLAVARSTGGGSEIYNYSFVTPTLTLLSSLNVGASAIDVEWSPAPLTGGIFLMAVASQVAGAHLRTYSVNAAGAAMALVSTANTTQNANTVSWNSAATFVVVGTVSGTNELQVYPVTSAGVIGAVNATFDVGAVAVNSVSWNKFGSNTDIIAVGTAATVAPATSLRLFRWTSGSLTEIPLSVVVNSAVNSVDWRLDGSCLAVGLSVDATNGEVRTYKFMNNDLILNTDIQNGSNVLSTRWSRDGRYLATGDVATDLEIYRLDQSFINLTNVFFNDVNMFLNGNLTLQDVSITFSGESIINGRGNTLTLAPTFSLIVKEGGSLLLQDITIEGVNDSKIRGLSTASTFSFQDATLVLDGDFTFSQGRFELLRNLTISGPNRTFIYSSNGQSIIRGGTFVNGSLVPPYYTGILMIDQGVTFSYVPANGSATLLTLEAASQIVLNSSTLFASTLQLTTGMLKIDGACTLSSSNKIIIGDGSFTTNNLSIEIDPAATLDIIGTISYSNV